jgi:pimeloyl-ACP methyl ester carboxylesterase
VTVDQNEGAALPTVEFDPANKIVPFPNNLLLDPTTGKVNLPEQCNESASSAATRVVLNKLDGFGTYETAINVTFTEPVDLTSLPGNVLLFERVHDGTTADPATALAIPVMPIAGKTVRYTDQTNIKACTGPTMVDQVTFIPAFPLEQKSTYTVALLSGIKTANGTDFNASFTWSLIRQPEPVVELDAAGNVITNRTPLDPLKPSDKAQLEGINLLWNAHHDAVSFLAGTGHASNDLLLAFEFNTMTVTDPLDPTVAGSPASTPTPLPLLGTQSLISAAVTNHLGPFAPCAPDGISDNECFLRVLLGGGNPDINVNYAIGKATCAAAGCAAISNTLGGLMLSKQYQTDVTNTLYTGTGSMPIPGAWTDPVHPMVVHDTNNADPTMNDAQAKISVLAFLPQPSLFPVPATGYPTVIFQHGITRSRGDVFGIVGGLTSSGFAVVAIDAPNHGGRAVRISDAANTVPELDCSDVVNQPLGPRPDHGPDPTTHPGCYAPPFTSDLAATRDGFRQTVLDLQQLVTSLEACGTTNCGDLKVDPTKILYIGHSMIGGNLGAIAMGTSDIKAGVLNAAGAGWFDILENTGETAAFQCPLVDALIDAGVLTGDKFDPATGTGLCTTPAWKDTIGYRSFSAIGRWILDPAEPGNFGAKLAPKTFLLQRINPDEVLPNLATENLGELSGQLRGDASCGAPNPSPPPQMIPSTALLAAPTTSQYLDYLTVPASAACPGNTFSHGSLLKPEAGTAGTLATVRLQTDAGYFLLSNQ